MSKDTEAVHEKISSLLPASVTDDTLAEIDDIIARHVSVQVKRAIDSTVAMLTIQRESSMQGLFQQVNS